MVPAAHANDGGGSIRIPASCCGLVGLKPTRGRNSLAPQYGDMMGGLVAEHVVTRSVRDSAAILDATAGPVPGDPYWAPPWRGASFAAAAASPPPPLRIAVMTASPTGSAVHPDCVAAAAAAATLCESLGHQVEDAALEVDGDAFVAALHQPVGLPATPGRILDWEARARPGGHRGGRGAADLGPHSSWGAPSTGRSTCGPSRSSR